MSKNIFKRITKNLLRSRGYDVIHETQLGNNILSDLKAIVQPTTDSVIFDIGANHGQTSLEFVKWFPESLIYSFEPDPEAFSQLEQQVKKFGKIKTYNVGFGNHAGRVHLNINKVSGGNSILPISESINEFAVGDWTEKIGQREVEITRLDMFCADHAIKGIDVVKIDTQGYEIRILEGAEQVVIPSFTKAVYIEVLFVELYQRQAYFADIYKVLTDRGYKLVGFYNTFRKVESPHFLLWCDALFVCETF